MNENGYRELERLVGALKGLRCWYVSCGGAAGPTFQLALGEKVSRHAPLKNAAHSEEYRRFEGEASLLVWCSWRLDGPDRPLTSSDDAPQQIVQELSRLVGAAVASVCLAPPGWDLTLAFSTGLVLRIFCDHVPGEPSFDGNWELWGRDATAFVGPGAHCALQPRTAPEGAGAGGDRAAAAQL